jgi:hypothetical protein
MIKRQPGVYLSSKSKEKYVIHGKRGDLIVNRRELDYIATDIQMMYHYDGLYGSMNGYLEEKEK